MQNGGGLVLASVGELTRACGMQTMNGGAGPTTNEPMFTS